MTIALSLTKSRAKGSPPEKNTTSKKELLTLILGKMQKGVDDFGEDGESESVKPITSPCDSVSGY